MFKFEVILELIIRWESQSMFTASIWLYTKRSSAGCLNCLSWWSLFLDDWLWICNDTLIYGFKTQKINQFIRSSSLTVCFSRFWCCIYSLSLWSFSSAGCLNCLSWWSLFLDDWLWIWNDTQVYGFSGRWTLWCWFCFETRLVDGPARNRFI